jgi:hypothetical protein
MRYCKLLLFLIVGLIGHGQDTLQKLNYAFLNQNSKQLKAYSGAYIHYERIFGELKVDFDSTLFQERYLDTNYIGLRKRQNMCRGCETQESRAIQSSYQKINGKKRFILEFPNGSVSPKRRPQLEMLSDTVEKKPWKRMGQYRFLIFRPHRYQWNNPDRFYYSDYRLFYSPGEAKFTLQLKKLNGFVEWDVRLANTSLDDEKAIEEHEDFFEDYFKILQKTERKFNAEMEKRLNRHQRNLNKRKQQSWQSFRRIYFSPEELLMTQKEWMEYYDEITQNEYKALKNSKPQNELLKRYLEAHAYQALSFNFRTDRDYCYPRFMLDSARTKTLLNYMIVRPGSKLYSLETSGVVIGDFPLFPGISGGEIIIGQDISGNFYTGIVPNVDDSNSDVVEIIVSPIDIDLASIGLLFSKYNL